MHQAPRPATRREVAYQFAILACVCLLILVTVATLLAWVWPGMGHSALRTIAFFAGPPLIMFLGFMIYGYMSEYRAERKRSSHSSASPACKRTASDPARYTRTSSTVHKHWTILGAHDRSSDGTECSTVQANCKRGRCNVNVIQTLEERFLGRFREYAAQLEVDFDHVRAVAQLTFRRVINTVPRAHDLSGLFLPRRLASRGR